MKKLILKCALLLCIVGTILYLGGAAYKQTNAYRNLERAEDTEKFNDIPNSIDIGIFGTSHALYGFKTAPEGEVMFNFALTAHTPQYQAAMLREFQDCLKPSALIVLTFSYSSPYTKETQATQPRYYRILSPENIVDVDLGRYWLGRLCPLLVLEPDAIVRAFLTPQPLTATSEERYGYKRISPEDIPEERERIQQVHWNDTIAPIYPDVNPVMWDAYHEMLELCQKQGWKAVLVTPPYLSDYNACFPDGFYESFLSRAEELSVAYGIPYLDYSHDSDFAECYDFYMDIDHMNLNGAAVFNEKFFSDVQALGLLG